MLSLWPELILQAFRDSPPGSALPSPLIAERAGIHTNQVTGRLGLMAEFEIVTRQPGSTKPMYWVIGPAADPALAIARMRQATQRPRPERPGAARTRVMRAQQTRVVGKLRALMQAGVPLDDGEAAKRLIDEAMDEAWSILAAKDWPGGRFTGAEVDLLVASELRQISEAAERARDNLRQALAMMLG